MRGGRYFRLDAPMRHGKAATVAVGSVISPPSGPRARAVSCPMCSDLLQTLRTLASDVLYPALPRSPCSQGPTEPLDPLGRMDEEEDPEGTPGPSSAGAPRARSTICCATHHACTPPSCTASPSLPARSLVLAVRVPMIYSCHRRSHRRLSPPYHHRRRQDHRHHRHHRHHCHHHRHHCHQRHLPHRSSRRPRPAA